MTRATLRLTRTPEAYRTLLAVFESVDAASEAVSGIIAARHRPGGARDDGPADPRAPSRRPTTSACPPTPAPCCWSSSTARRSVSTTQMARVEAVCRAHGARELRLARDDAERAALWKAPQARLRRRRPPGAQLLHAGRRGAAHPRARHPARHRRAPPSATGSASATSSTPATATSIPSCCSTSATPTRSRACSPPGREILEACVALGGSVTGEHGIGVEKIAQMPLLFAPDDLLAMTHAARGLRPRAARQPAQDLPRRQGVRRDARAAAPGGALTAAKRGLKSRPCGARTARHGRPPADRAARRRARELLPDRRPRAGRARLRAARRRRRAAHRRCRRAAAALLGRRPRRRRGPLGDPTSRVVGRLRWDGTPAHDLVVGRSARDGVRRRHRPLRTRSSAAASPRRSGCMLVALDRGGPGSRADIVELIRAAGSAARSAVAARGAASTSRIMAPAAPGRRGTRSSSTWARRVIDWAGIVGAGLRRGRRPRRPGRRHRAGLGGATGERRRRCRRWCARALALVASGLGAHLDVGAPPRALDVMLRLDRLDRVLDHQAADMTVTVEAGCSLATLQATLAARRASGCRSTRRAPERTTVGGLVAANLSGPLRASQGTRARSAARAARSSAPAGRWCAAADAW